MTMVTEAISLLFSEMKLKNGDSCSNGKLKVKPVDDIQLSRPVLGRLRGLSQIEIDHS